MTTHYTKNDTIAILTLDNPPVNGLGFETRRTLMLGLKQALEDNKIKAIILTGSGQAFSGGADIREFGTPLPLKEPILPTCIATLENSSKPVVAAIHTVCMGGGLELAMGAHYRVVARGCKIALPEVKLGLLPGAGGTQRLPRALGFQTALDMIIKGHVVLSETLFSLPQQQLIDILVSDTDIDHLSLLDQAIAFAQQVIETTPLPRLRDRSCFPPSEDPHLKQIRQKVEKNAKGFLAPLRCMDALEAALYQPFDEGLALERSIFLDLLNTAQCRALRHVFAAERATQKVPHLPKETPVRSIQSVAVVGAGTMGCGIALACLNADLPVILLETHQAALDKGMMTLQRYFASQVQKSHLSATLAQQRQARIHLTLQMADLAEADLVIEAVFETFEIKEQVFRQLDEYAKTGAILASNTSTLDLNRIALVTKRPQDVVGLHFFSPAHVMKLLEVVRGTQTAPDVLATALHLAKRLRKTAVVAGVCDGFIGNRMIEAFIRQALLMLDEGASPERIDTIIETFGFAMGPFRMSDLAGNDIGWAIRKRHALEKPHQRYSAIADKLCELGRFGQKTGAGWYDYPSGREAVSSPIVTALLAEHRTTLTPTHPPRTLSDDEILHRLILALVNEGARLLEEGIANKASDIDIVYLYGYGFPAYRGGPMHYANEIGLTRIREMIKTFAQNPYDDASFWEVAPLINQLADQNLGF